MARFNEIQVGRFNAILHKLLDMKEGAPAPQLSGDIIPTIVLENDRREYAFLAGEQWCQQGYFLAAGGAGTLAKIGLYNPTGSGVLCVLENAHLSLESAGRVTLKTATSFVGSVLSHPTDSRTGSWDGSKRATCQVRYLADATAPGAVVDEYRVLSNTVLQLDMRHWILSPGWGVHFHNPEANEYMMAGFTWRERVMEKSEAR